MVVSVSHNGFTIVVMCSAKLWLNLSKQRLGIEECHACVSSVFREISGKWTQLDEVGGRGWWKSGPICADLVQFCHIAFCGSI